MKKLGNKGRAWLKILHIFFSCLWVGGSISVMLLLLLKGNLQNGDELYAMNIAIKIIDDLVIIPGAIGALVTGLIYGFLTEWGFTKFNWVFVKLIIAIAINFIGAVFLSQWQSGMVEISNIERITALENPTYLYYKQMVTVVGTVQAIILTLTIYVSVSRPWGRRGKSNKTIKN